MPNHPNRNWRARMHAACAEWLGMWRWPAGGAGILSADQLRDLMGVAYKSGFEAGRASLQPKSTEKT